MTSGKVSLNCELDPLVQQYINQELYSAIIKIRCASISNEEENVDRYATDMLLGMFPLPSLRNMTKVWQKQPHSL